MRAFSNARTVGRICATDRLLILELYSLCIWPAEPFAPAVATTCPISYDFLGQRLGLKRNGAETAVGRARDRGWVTTEPDEVTGFLIYSVQVGRILDDLISWGEWTIASAKAARPPSRQLRTTRAPRTPGRAPRRPAQRQRPQSMPLADLVRRWRATWPEARDPTATLAALLQRGATPRELSRVMTSLEGSGLTRPAPSYLIDRWSALSYQSPRGSSSAEAPGSSSSAEAPAAEAPAAEPAAEVPAAEADAPTAVVPPHPRETPTEAGRRRLAEWLSSSQSPHGGERSADTPAPGGGHAPKEDPPDNNGGNDG